VRFFENLDDKRQDILALFERKMRNFEEINASKGKERDMLCLALKNVNNFQI